MPYGKVGVGGTATAIHVEKLKLLLPSLNTKHKLMLNRAFKN
jgi:hypothetical protein